MAFNPFANFRKYPRIWMVTILLLCMVTFVLCTGTKGDFMDWVSISLVQGTVVGKIDGSSLYSSELHDIKTRRNIANEFMTKGRIRLLERIDEFLKPENLKKFETQVSSVKEREERIQHAQQLRQQVELTGKEKRY